MRRRYAMQKYALNHDWQFTEGSLRNPLMMNMLSGWKACQLPHDAQIIRPRDPNSLTEDNEGWTTGAAVFYRKEFFLTEEAEGKRCFLEFEGIAGICEIWVNGQYVAKHMNPYTSIMVEISDLVHIGENTIQVHVDSRMKPNSRWYVGTGLYRKVWLHLSEQVTVVPNSLHVSTKSLTGRNAELAVSAVISGEADRICFTLLDNAGQVMAETKATPEAGKASATLSVEGITAWSPEHPAMYTLRATICAGGTEDVTEVRTGIRTISVDPQNGFRLNGVSMKLRGGCIHHDLGLLGAADYDAAERRRIRILRESGFNAVRGAHNPFSPSFYEICDELGMLVIEEAFDEWVLGRTDFGLHITFEDRWVRDLEDMVLRDYNHPSIIMWSIGNEVEERDGSADGYAWSRRLADKVRSLDATRPVSASACSLFLEYTQRPSADADKGVTGNQALNMAYDSFAEGRDLWGPATAPYFAPLDVAGYNYKVARYAYDGEKYPERVIYGSESYPRAALQSWWGVEENAHVIGDFVWTAWDYLGEVGVGRWEVSESSRPGSPEYPWLLANCSDIDVLGQKRPQSYYRDVVWQNSKGPKLFCLPPELTGRNIARLSWGWLPVRAGYTCPSQDGQMLEAHVYADCDEVALYQNGNLIAKAPCSKEEEYHAVFTLPYVPGNLTAIAYADGEEIGRDTLTTAGPTASLALTADRTGYTADGDDLAFVMIHAMDADGNPVTIDETCVTVHVLGDATLLALGSADPKPDRLIPYGGDTCPLFEGNAMAIVRCEKGGKGCRIEAELENGIRAQLTLSFAPCTADDAPVQDVRARAVDLPLETLVTHPAALTILRELLGPMLDGDTFASVKGMSLKKLMAVGGKALPPETVEALDASLRVP